MAMASDLSDNFNNLIAENRSEGEPVARCLICHLKCSSTEILSTRLIGSTIVPSLVSKQLDVYFVLKHVLELPSEHLENYLRHCPHPEHWIKICLACRENYVEKCSRLFMEWMEVKRRFVAAKREVIEVIKKSVEIDGKPGNEGDDGSPHLQQFILDICKETRSFVRQNEYEDFVIDPVTFTDGDLMAREKLENKKRKRMKTDIYKDHYLSSSSLSHQGNVIPSPDAQEASSDHHDDIFVDNEVKLESTFPSEHNQSHSDADPFISGDFKDYERLVDEKTKDVGRPLADELILVEEREARNNQDQSDEQEVQKTLTSNSEDEEDDVAACEANSSIQDDSGGNEWVAESDLESRTGTDSSEAEDKTVKTSSKRKRTNGKISSHTVLSNRWKRLKCDHCEEIYSTEKSLRHHQIDSHKINLFECTECGWKTVRESFLPKHMKRHHGDEQDLKDLTCPTCQKIFSAKNNLKDHIHRMHEKRRKFKCKFCEKEYGDKAQLLTHLGCVHGIKDKLRFHCSFDGCGKAFFKKSQLSIHEAHHKPPEYKCQTCGATFILPWSLKRHMELYHPPEGTKPVKYQCELCQREFVRKDNLNTHMKWCVTRKSYKCLECDSTFFTQKALREHREKTHGQGESGKRRDRQSKREGDEDSVNSEGKDLKRQHNTEFECSICQKVLASEQKLKLHTFRIHSGEWKMSKCEHCDVEYRDKTQLLIHMGNVHGIKDNWRFHCSFEGCGESFYVKNHFEDHQDCHKAENYECAICGKLFRTKKRLDRHSTEMHSSDEAKKFACEFCPARFVFQGMLNTHMKTRHKVGNVERKRSSPKRRQITRKRKILVDASSKKSDKESESIEKFLCPICGLALKSKLTLDNHTAVVHEKKFQATCDICGNIFATSKYLTEHQFRVHKIGNLDFDRFPCTFEGCTRKFPHMCLLKEHIMLRHEGQRPHQCNLCGKRVQTSYYLRRHIMAMHSSNRETKPFKCEQCGKGFATKSYLDYHKRTHRPKKEQLQQL